ncbi:DegT/DnrJ/EryC1/StrS family aminotransferase [Rufibacter glacialis]|uniref:DegT/DnrJ/EryC1/StrS family aminotransferase n=1 Tax=Rufibacter glacialis TaxID=1259555 RepID=A0A5M8QN90_9BACT|nr:DegT/DnrJ/EryC1/StrS family aminotransferase [Rufibacter glacialis]KAA6437605.1 DegT/DnrJ/EryC1/StrS family aminotransferase [Rufibacter glacialis]GGK57885.1 aminotransferase DegT [Rufibacter glacialis]
MNINVTKAFLPPIEEYQKYIENIFKTVWLTNNGPLLNELELKLKEYLSVPHMLYLSNGTVAIQIAIKALQLKGGIITTPFSYVATTSSIVWEQCNPIFVDIDPYTFNIDPAKIEAAITSTTTAILATHVFGNPCEIEAIQTIADKYGLKVIYDAAHCFGTKYKGKSVFQYGDISTTSFHATKLFHTVEGGAVFTNQPNLLKKMALLRNFGHTTPSTFDGIGINAKNSELHSAMGLCVLKYANQIMVKRKEQWNYYKEKLVSLEVQFLSITEGTDNYNASYFPVIFKTEEQLLQSVEALNLQGIFPRRYFYPSLNQLNYVSPVSCPFSERIAKTVLCLPMYHDLSMEEQDMISRVLLRIQNN